MAEVAEWKALDSKELNQPSSEDIEGVSIMAYASPYDVPKAIRVHMYPDKCHFLIEFKYMGGEEAIKPEIEDGHVKLWLGRDSQRLCRIEVDLKQDEPEAVKKVIDKLFSRPQTPPRKDNYEITKKILLSYLHSWDSPECRHLAEPTG